MNTYFSQQVHSLDIRYAFWGRLHRASLHKRSGALTNIHVFGNGWAMMPCSDLGSSDNLWCEIFKLQRFTTESKSNKKPRLHGSEFKINLVEIFEIIENISIISK